MEGASILSKAKLRPISSGGQHQRNLLIPYTPFMQTIRAHIKQSVSLVNNSQETDGGDTKLHAIKPGTPDVIVANVVMEKHPCRP